MRMGPDSGFTLIEIVVAVMIMTLLVGIAAPSFMATLNSERRTATESELEGIAEGILRYAADTEQLPQSLDDLYSSNVPGFGGPYVDDAFGGRPVPKDGYRNDAWGHPYVVTVVSATSIQITSPGKDGLIGTADDISRDVSIRPVLRDISVRRLGILNQAVQSYNARNLPDHPLPSSTQSAVTSLVSGGYLPSVTPYATDAFGDPWVPTGVPLVEFRSINFGSP